MLADIDAEFTKVKLAVFFFVENTKKKCGQNENT